MPRKTNEGVRVPKASVRGQTFTRLLYASDDGATETVDSAATVQLPSDCFLIGVEHVHEFVSSGNNEEYISEVSTSGNFQGSTNGNSDTIHVIASRTREVTTGMYNTAVIDSLTGIRIPFAAGERIHLNMYHTASKTLVVRAVLHFEQR